MHKSVEVARSEIDPTELHLAQPHSENIFSRLGQIHFQDFLKKPLI